MERVTLSHSRVKELSQEFVPVLLNSDTEANARQVMIHLVKDLPTVIFFSPSGHRLFELPYHARFDPRRTAHYMQRALETAKQTGAEEQRLRKAAREAPGSLEASDALERFYRKGFRFDDALSQARQGYDLSLSTGKGDDDQRMSEMLFYELKLRRFAQAGRTIEAFKQRYPKSKHLERVEYYRGLQTFYGKDDLDGAEKIWQEQLDRWPTGGWSKRGKNMLRRSRILQRDREKLGEAFPRDSKSWGGK